MPLQNLAEGWRRKAAAIEIQFKEQLPDTAQLLVDAFESCASELEEQLRLQNLNPPPA